MPNNPFQFEFDARYASLRDFALQIEHNLNLICYKGRGLSDEDLHRFVCLHEQIHNIADHTFNAFALRSADEAVAALREDLVLSTFILFAQNQNCFELEIKSDGFLLFLHFIQANVQPVIDKSILYTAGVPERTLISQTGKNSAQLADFITEQYSQFNHRLNFAIVKSSIRHIFRLCGYQEIPSTKTMIELSAVFDQFYIKTRENLDVSDVFSLLDINKMQTFLTVCQDIFTYQKQPADYESKIMMCEVLRSLLTRYQSTLTIIPKNPPSSASCSSTLFSRAGASGSREPIHVNATPLMIIKHEMICAFEKHIDHLEKKAASIWHRDKTNKLAAAKASLLKKLKTAVYLADSEATCKAVLEEKLKDDLLATDRSATTSKLIIKYYETFCSDASGSSHTPKTIEFK